MPAPYNYTGGFIDPTQSMMQTLQMGNMLGQMGERRDARQAATEAAEQAKIEANQAAIEKAERDARIAAAWKAAVDNPSGGAFEVLSNLQPTDINEQIRKNVDSLDSAVAAKSLRDLGEVYAAFESNNPEIAIKIMQEKADAYGNAGDKKKQEEVNMLISTAKTGPLGQQSAKVMFGLMMAPLPGGKDAIDAIVKLAEEQRAKTIAGQLEKDKKEGKLDPDKKFGYELQLNKEYTTRAKGFTEALRLETVIKDSAADKSGAGDLALVTTFMKMLDPGSVVRESEFAKAQDTAGLLGKLTASAAKVQSGQILTPQQREDFARLAGQYMAATAEQEKKARKDLDFMVKNYGLNRENVFGTMADREASSSELGATSGAMTLRDYIKTKWPGEIEKIDKLSDAELETVYKKTTAAYKLENAKPAKTDLIVEEVDY